MTRKVPVTVLFALVLAFAGVASGQDEAPLRIIEKPRPHYSDDARRHLTTGEVVLRVELRADGKVGKIDVLRGLPHGLTEMAIEAARKIKFEPKRVAGAAVSDIKSITYGFDIPYDSKSERIKTEAKIIQGPVFNFTDEDLKALGKKTYNLKISFSRAGRANLILVDPKVSEELKAKFAAAVRGIKFEPALNINDERVTLFKFFDFTNKK